MMIKFLLSFVLFALSMTTAHAVTTSKDITITVTAVSAGGGDEEFVGPFPTWINAKTGAPFGGGGAVCTGATGNGTTDDAAAIQSCLNLLQAGTQTTLYFPAGTYRINSTLTMASQV